MGSVYRMIRRKTSQTAGRILRQGGVPPVSRLFSLFLLFPSFIYLNIYIDIYIRPEYTEKENIATEKPCHRH